MLALPTAYGMRVLLLGAFNSPHLEYLAKGLVGRGHDVHLAGSPSPAIPVNPAGGPAEVTAAPPYLGRKRDVLAAARWLRRVVRRTSADVVHAHYFYPGYTTAAVLARAAPVVITTWGSDLLLPKLRREQLEDRLAVRLADALTADSQTLVDALVAIGTKPSKIRLVRWGVDLNLFKQVEDRVALRRELGLGPGPMVLSPRTLRPLYNIPTLVEAFEPIASAHGSVQLVLKYFAGEPPDLSASPYRDRIHLVGTVPYAQMASYYAAADVCVSIPSSDSSPRSVWEAMACGAPCIVSDLPWVAELIENETHALVVPPGAEALTAAMGRLLSEPELSARLSRRGGMLVERHHDGERELARLEATYRSVTAGRARARAARNSN